MDAISLTSAYESLKIVRNILTTLFEVKVDSAIQSKIHEAQTKLGDVQDVLSELRERLSAVQQERDDLKTKLANAETWQTLADQYKLAKTPGGDVVYKYKDEPNHFACPSCFNKHEIHILQDNATCRCPGCGAKYAVKPQPFYSHVKLQKLPVR